MKRRSVILSAVVVSAWTALALPAQAQSTPPAPTGGESLFMYKGADRQQKLLADAKREGKLVWYTSLAPTESTPLAQAFEKKVGIHVEVWRAQSAKVLQRILTEGQARHYSFDVVETNSPEVEMIAREKLLTPFYSPYLADLPAFALPAHGMWAADRMAVYGVAYNTKLVRREDLPKTYGGFLDPKWKGRIAVESTDGEWMGAMIKAMGEERGMEFMRKLAEMRPDVRAGHILLAELVSAGEVPVALTAYKSNAVAIKKRGGPIDFIALNPVVVRPEALGIAGKAPHPASALLFADFMLSPEGQTLLESVGRSPVSNKVNPDMKTKVFMIDPAALGTESEKYEKAWETMFVKK